MDGVSTMILSDNDSSSMTPLFGGSMNNQPPSHVPFSQDQLTYSPNIAVGPPPSAIGGFTGAPGPAVHAQRGLEKTIGVPHMDSTPISDIMGPEVDYPGQGQYAVPQQQMVQQQQAPQQAAASGGKKGNLTPEQMDALLAGVAAVIAFYKPVQEKLAGMIPQMVGAGGETSNVGLLITALVAAIIFYFGRRFIK
jgi:hypothetical protein